MYCGLEIAIMHSRPRQSCVQRLCRIAMGAGETKTLADGVDMRAPCWRRCLLVVVRNGHCIGWREALGSAIFGAAARRFGARKQSAAAPAGGVISLEIINIR